MLKRSDRVRTHRGKWAGVSGSVDADSPLEQALVEIREETGLEGDAIRLLREGEPLDIPDSETGTIWRVHPFVFQIEDPLAIRLDWEHTESRWIDPGELDDLDTVPRLRETWDRVWTT